MKGVLLYYTCVRLYIVDTYMYLGVCPTWGICQQISLGSKVDIDIDI